LDEVKMPFVINPGCSHHTVNNELKVVFITWDIPGRCHHVWNAAWAPHIAAIIDLYTKHIHPRTQMSNRPVGAVLGAWYESHNFPNEVETWAHELKLGNVQDSLIWDVGGFRLIRPSPLFPSVPASEHAVKCASLDIDEVVLEFEKGLRKPKEPTLKPEVMLNAKDFAHIDYMAAVRASCGAKK
jgi:hypothetical protein